MSGEANPAAGAPEAPKTGDGAPAPESGSAGTGPAESATGRVFTQAEFDAAAAAIRRKAEADAAAVADKAKKWDEHLASQQTETEKAQAAQRAAEETASARIAEANAKLKAADIRLTATEKGVRPEALPLVLSALLASESITVDDKGQVTGTADAVDALLKSNDYLKAQPKDPPPPKSGGEFGGKDGKTIDEQIAEAESKGDWKAARTLKLRKYESRST